jgi:hypothetical protein
VSTYCPRCGWFGHRWLCSRLPELPALELVGGPNDGERVAVCDTGDKYHDVRCLCGPSTDWLAKHTSAAQRAALRGRALAPTDSTPRLASCAG